MYMKWKSFKCITTFDSRSLRFYFFSHSFSLSLSFREPLPFICTRQKQTANWEARCILIFKFSWEWWKAAAFGNLKKVCIAKMGLDQKIKCQFQLLLLLSVFSFFLLYWVCISFLVSFLLIEFVSIFLFLLFLLFLRYLFLSLSISIHRLY